MNEKAKALLGAVMIAVLLPGMMFSIAEKKMSHQVPSDTTKGVTEQVLDVTVPLTTGGKKIPVILNDGTVNTMDMDTYITGVVLGEMPADFDIEALKAQAVVARTYAYKRHITGQKHKYNAVCTESSCCQSYISQQDYLSQGGTEESIQKITQAVQDTTGQVLTYNDVLIEATYFSCSGGKTEDAQAVWGTAIPYLQAVDSPGEENATHYKDTVKFTAKEFSSLLKLTPVGAPTSWVSHITYTPGGGVDTIKICGVTYKGTVLRQKLGLRSTVFTIMIVGNDVHIQTKGFGHRVGMSQYGAEAMAVNGSDYQQILSHYYPNTVLQEYLEN